MGKKHAHEEHENHERWVISFADMMTLLFALFVVLYALKEEAVREAQASIAFYLNIQGLSKTNTQGIFAQGNHGGQTRTSHLIFSAEQGPMQQFVEGAMADYKKQGGRSLEIRETDEGLLYRMPLSELYEGIDDDVRDSFRDWLRSTIDGSSTVGDLLRIKVEVTKGDVALPGGRTVSRESLSLQRLVKLLRWIEIDSRLREDQIQVEFRHYTEGQALIRSREPWQDAARLSFLFVVTE